MSEAGPSDRVSVTRQQPDRGSSAPSELSAPFLARFAGPRQLAPTPRGETTITEAVETSDER